MQQNFSIYKERRKSLINSIKSNYPNQKGFLVINASFEHERYKFRQDSTFYYLTGLEEPAVILVVNIENLHTSLYVPQYGESRSKWFPSIIYGATQAKLSLLGIDEILYLGNNCKGYSMTPGCIPEEYEYFIAFLNQTISNNKVIFTSYNTTKCTESSLFINQLINVNTKLKNAIIDVSSCIDTMRRTKSRFELEEMYKAVDCTMAAHEAAAHIIEPGKYEYQVQAGIEFVFTESGGTIAFPSIVASGSHSTTLHYTSNKGILKKGDLVIVDIGAELNYYCADLTRTYPVSGTFTKRQLEIYNIVLKAQKYIESIAKPGFWLINKNEPNKSLHHLVCAFFEKQGYGSYFTHGLGHYLGLDVHDVGSYSEPLKEGDIITLEPGLYIPEESIGVRIEDNYWLISNGIACLSQELPKDPHTIEEMMIHEHNDEYEDHYV